MMDGSLELLKELESSARSPETTSLKSNRRFIFVKCLVFMFLVISPLHVGLNGGCYFNVSL